MAAVRIKVGASSDGSMALVFKPLEDAAKRARVTIANEMKLAAGEVAAGYRDAPAYAKKGFGGAADEAEKADRRIVDSSAKAARERAKDIDHVLAIHQRYEREVERGLARQEAANRRVGTAALRSFGGYMGRAAGFAGGIARGIGVNVDPGALVGNVVGQQAAATNVSSSGYLEGAAGAAGVRQDPKKILAEARDAADAARISTDTALEGLQAFVGKTTDLETGRALLTEMAKQSKATGSSMSDVMSAAGSIAVKMGDVPNKTEAVSSLMGIIAKQGKIGAVEMSTMAAQIAGFIGPANKFKEGIAGAVTEMGTLFQVTNKFGGVKGPAQAATSVASFVSDLTSKSGMKALKAAGVKDSDIFADKGKTQLKDLKDIIPVLLEKTGGDLTKLAKEMPNKRSKSVLDAFAQLYNEGERGGKGGGKAAVAKTFSEYGGGTSSQDFKDALSAANETTASKVQLFNNQLEKIAEQGAAKLLPALEKLGPSIIAAVDAFAKVTGWAAENPGKAITAAIAASIGKAAIGDALAKSIAGAIGGKGGLALGAVALTATAVTLITETMEQKAAAGEESAGAEVDYNQRLMMKAAKQLKATGSVDQETKAALLQARAEMEQETQQGEAATKRSRLGSAKDLIFGDLTLKQMGRENEFEGRKEQIENQKMNIEAILAKAKVDPGEIARAMQSGVLKVQVVGGGAPVPDPGGAGRTK
jgi:hypothetical protein